MSKVKTQLREAAKKSGLSIRQLSTQSNLSYSIVHGFMVSGCGLAMRCGGKLAHLLGLELRPAERTRKGAK